MTEWWPDSVGTKADIPHCRILHAQDGLTWDEHADSHAMWTKSALDLMLAHDLAHNSPFLAQKICMSYPFLLFIVGCGDVLQGNGLVGWRVGHWLFSDGAS